MPTSNGTPPDMLSSLRQDLLAPLPLPTAFAVYIMLLLMDHLFGVQPAIIWCIGLWALAGALLAQWLKPRRPQLAALTYIGGVAGAGAALIVATGSALAIAVFTATMVLAVALLGGAPMAAITALGVAATLGPPMWHRGRLDTAVLAPLFVLLFTATVAWLSHRSLITAVHWAWASYRQARSSADEVRERRAELLKTLRALDEAYHRLERFSAQLAQAREAAQEARHAKQQFVATVSHELRTPLNIIIGFAELMTNSPESYGVRRVPRQFIGDVNRIYRSAQHLRALIDDVLDLSQVDAGHMVLLAEQASIQQVIHEATDVIWSLATQKGLQLVVEVPASLPAILCDTLRIRQVLLNLLSNAVRFTDAGRISVTACLAAREVEVTVADTGPGIAPADLERAFEEFHQLDSTLSRRHDGTGLGLALSRRFVELHGGRMWVESQVGKGSAFHFTLPLVPPSAGMGGQLTPVPIPPGVMAQAQRSIVVASAEPLAASLLKRHLRGYQVTAVPLEELPQAVAAQMPWAVIRSNSPDTPANGRQTQVLPAGAPPVRVISCPLPDPSMLSRRLGVDHYLVKPVTRERLLSLLSGYRDRVRRVLVVDDDAELADLVARSIAAMGMDFETDVAYGGRGGWTRIQEWRPDLVLLDLGMPELDGLAVLRLLKASEQLRMTHVVVLTARDVPDGEASLPGSSNICLTSPMGLTVDDVLTCLQAMLDALPPPMPVSSLPPAPGAGPPAPPAS